jgi:general secretion pathway protein D
MVLAGLLAACHQPDVATVPPQDSPAYATPPAPPGSSAAAGANRPIPLLAPGQRAGVARAEIELGTGRLIGAAPGQPPGLEIAPGGEVTLDLVNVDVRDVARSVLGDLLKLPYAVDATLQGTVTLRTGRPIPRSAVLGALTDALALSGIALVERGGLVQLVPLANAPREARLAGPDGAGFVTRVVTPANVAAADLARVLEPLLPAGAAIRADPARNALIISGTERTIAEMLDNLAVFDVDALKGLSFALLPLRNAPPREVAREIASMLGGGGSALAGLVRVVPVDRLHAVLVTSVKPEQLRRVRGWIEWLDQGGGSDERQFYVYRVQNGRAVDLAAVLRKAIGIEAGSAGGGARPPASVLPPLPGTGGPGPPGAPGGAFGAGVAAPGAANVPPVLAGDLPAAPPAGTPDQDTGQAGTGAAMPSGGGSGPRITADEINNALVITATPHEYAQIEAALLKLDIPPLQVLVEATIAEVTLTNQLSFGLQYFIKSGNFRAFFGTPPTDQTGNGSSISAPFPGFSLIPGLNAGFVSNGGTNVVLQALSQLTNIRVLSSPNLLVLNNQSARLQVGDQVPIATQSAVSTIVPNAPVVNSIEYRDTGVILSVTPRVNAGGLMLLDITEEVSNPTTTTTSSLTSPTISERRVTSSVAIGDGQTIALGGLIQDSRQTDKTGIPLLSDIPVIGALFGTRNNQLTRTELIVMITPHIVRDRRDAEAVTEELRQKLRLAVPVLHAHPP